MSPAKVLVLFLNLVSLGAVLVTAMLVVGPFLIPPESRFTDTPIGTLSPGCFSAIYLVFLTPLSLLPAMAGWMVRERVVLPQETAERFWMEATPLREDRLWIWIRFVTDLLFWGRAQREVLDDSVQARIRFEIPRALQELDSGRRQRLLLFLREVGLEEPKREDLAGRGSELPEPRLESRRLPMGLVRVAVTGLSLVSGFFLLWAGLIALTFAKANPLQIVGADVGPAHYVFALFLPLTIALVCGLGAAGLLRMSRTMNSSDPFRTCRADLSALVLRQILNQFELLGTWRNKDETLPRIRRIGRAVVLIAVPELGGEERGALVKALFQGGWVTGTGSLSLQGADFRVAELTGANLPRVSLAQADLSGADLSSANLEEADLEGCGLRGSNLRSCHLVGADLRGADLRAARLQKAVLAGTDLRGALLEGANFWGADLAAADLSGTQGTAESFT